MKGNSLVKIYIMITGFLLLCGIAWAYLSGTMEESVTEESRVILEGEQSSIVEESQGTVSDTLSSDQGLLSSGLDPDMERANSIATIMLNTTINLFTWFLIGWFLFTVTIDMMYINIPFVRVSLVKESEWVNEDGEHQQIKMISRCLGRAIDAVRPTNPDDYDDPASDISLSNKKFMSIYLKGLFAFVAKMVGVIVVFHMLGALNNNLFG